MPFPYDRYPWLNFQELNLAYFIEHFREIFQQWSELLEDQEVWKTATEQDIADWKADTLSALSDWQDLAEQNIAGWEADTMAALNAWQTAAETTFEAIRVEAAADAASASASATAADAAKTAALAAQTAAETAAATISSEAAQIVTNTKSISELDNASQNTKEYLGIEFPDVNTIDYSSLTNGYLSTTGTISPPTADNEVASDFIPVSSGQLFRAVSTTPGKTGWVAVCFYDSSHEKTGSRRTASSADVSTLENIRIPNTATQYMRISWKAFDDPENLKLYNVSDEDEELPVLLKQIENLAATGVMTYEKQDFCIGVPSGGAGIVIPIIAYSTTSLTTKFGIIFREGDVLSVMSNTLKVGVYSWELSGGNATPIRSPALTSSPFTFTSTHDCRLYVMLQKNDGSAITMDDYDLTFTIKSANSDEINAIITNLEAYNDSVSLKRHGIVTAAELAAGGYNNLIQLPDGYIYAIPASLSVDGKPTELNGASFSFLKFRNRDTSDYGVMLAIGRNAAYYALFYTGDASPYWINFYRRAMDDTLASRWGQTHQIVLLGDSIVQGMGSSDYSATGDTIITIGGATYKRNTGVKSWAAQFKAKMESQYYGFTVINNGIEGAGISVITDNLDNLVTNGTTMAIVCVGINNRMISASTILNYYNALFDALLAKNIKVLALSAIDVNGANFQSSPALINTALEKSCDDKQIPYYNLYGEFNAVLYANTKSDYYYDTLHPNDKGHSTLYGLICKLLNY